MAVTAISRQGTRGDATETDIVVTLDYATAAYVLGFIRQVRNGAQPLGINQLGAERLETALESAGVDAR